MPTRFRAYKNCQTEVEQGKVNDLHRLWLSEHQQKIKELVGALNDIFSRLENFGEEINERLESPEYLNLVRRCFRSWDEADTQEKKQMLKKLITNAGAIKLCDDDLVRLFIAWIDQYHETHFLVIKEIYKHPGTTRARIWDNIHGARPREGLRRGRPFPIFDPRSQHRRSHPPRARDRC